MSKGISGVGITALTTGSVLVWSGFKGYSILKAAQNVIQGQPPGTGQSANLLTSNATGTTTATATGGGGPVRGSYSHAQLVQLWTANGGDAATANNAACHAIQESSGNPKASSSNPDGGTNYGLWQLDTKGVGAGHSVAELTDPNSNAKITIAATGNGRNWSQWSTPGC